MINEPQINTFAVSNRTIDFLNHSLSVKEDFDKDMIIHKWSYDPGIFVMNGIADPLSVYLEIGNTDDERIEKALEDLLEGIKW